MSPQIIVAPAMWPSCRLQCALLTASGGGRYRVQSKSKPRTVKLEPSYSRSRTLVQSKSRFRTVEVEPPYRGSQILLQCRLPPAGCTWHSLPVYGGVLTSFLWYNDVKSPPYTRSKRRVHHLETRRTQAVNAQSTAGKREIA